MTFCSKCHEINDFCCVVEERGFSGLPQLKDALTLLPSQNRVISKCLPLSQYEQRERERETALKVLQDPGGWSTENKARRGRRRDWGRRKESRLVETMACKWEVWTSSHRWEAVVGVLSWWAQWPDLHYYKLTVTALSKKTKTGASMGIMVGG